MSHSDKTLKVYGDVKILDNLQVSGSFTKSNSWDNVIELSGGAVGDVYYFKDEVGVVHVKLVNIGVSASGVVNIPNALPVNFRPIPVNAGLTAYAGHVLYNFTEATTINFIIDQDGDIYIGGTNTNLYSSQFSFLP